MEITQELLQEKINNGEKLIVDFYTDWCRPCGLMKPVFEKVSEHYRNENSKVQLYTMNVEKNKDIAGKYGIRSVPTIKSFSGGKEVHSQSGVQMESQIKQFVNNLING
jgi:thioredoxin 1